LFGVVNTGGKIRFAYPRPNLNPADVTDADHLVIFPERFATKLRTDFTVSITEPGDYGSDEIIADGDQLTNSDEVLGKRRFVYPSNRTQSLKNDDRLSLSQDRRTLKLDWQVGQDIEHGLIQIRVIVDVSDARTVR
jgi:hypothetical protein